MPTFTPAQAKKILAKRGITDPAVVKRAIKQITRGRERNRVIGSQTPSTMPVSGFQPGVSGAPGLLEGLRSGFMGEVPGAGLFGGLGQAIGRAGIGAGRFLLRAPGTRQAAEGLAGRATTLRPLLGRGPTLGQAAAFAGGVIAGEAIIGAGEGILDIAQRRFEGPRAPQRGLATMQHGTGRAMARLPGVGGQLPPGATVVKVWTTGTANFARLADGRMAVQKKDGTIKTWRPQKHIVISRNPRVGTLIRADKRLDRLVKGLRKAVRSGKR